MHVPAARTLEAGRLREVRGLDARVSEAIRRGWDAPLSEAEVDGLARDLFAHQFRHCRTARAWWRSRGVTETSVRGWRDVPGLPVSAYKTTRVAAFPRSGRPERPRFLSSGTTVGARSRVHLENVDLYEAAIVPPFRRHALPERDRMRLLFLSAPPGRAPQSSLVHMFGVLRETCGAAGSAFLSSGDLPDADALGAALADAEAGAEPVFLLGAAFAFVHALDGLRASGASFRAPRGSRLFQTGGFKGRSREVAPGELLDAYEEMLGIPRDRVVNEYGMAELASQFYARADGRYSAPPWVRWRVLDPIGLGPAVAGEPGVLAIWDLANRSHCFALLTEDLAVARGSAFELVGRAAGSEPRGCSLDADIVVVAGAATR
jgi:hypothetical protein